MDSRKDSSDDEVHSVNVESLLKISDGLRSAELLSELGDLFLGGTLGVLHDRVLGRVIKLVREAVYPLSQSCSGRAVGAGRVGTGGV